MNGRIAEIYFDAKKNRQMKILGHTYVRPEEYTTKKEKGWLREDVKHYRFSYRKGVYRSVLSGA